MDPFILVFAILAGFLCYKLYTVLGTRGGHEPEDDARPQFELRERPEQPEPLPQPEIADENLPQWVKDVRAVYPGFAEGEFLKGAQAAYEMIVEAFAKGQMADIKTYLDPGVFRAFSDAVEARDAAGQKSEVQFVGIEKATILGAKVEQGYIEAVVEFRSNQIRTLKDKDGTIIDGDPNRIDLVKDRWAFSRPVSSADPNWILTATGGAAPSEG